MSDESSDSLPSPGFVSVFRNRRLSSLGQEEEAEGECPVEGGTEGEEADRGEADRGREADRGGKANRGGGDIGEGNIGDVGGAEYKPSLQGALPGPWRPS